MVRWTDGLIGGLIAGTTLVVFYAIVCGMLMHDASVGGFFQEIGAPLLRAVHVDSAAAAIGLGVVVHYIVTAALGIGYATLATAITSMRRAPFSILWGLGFGLFAWFVRYNVVVPILAIPADLPLWEGLVGYGVFFGFVMSEFLTFIGRMKAAQA